MNRRAKLKVKKRETELVKACLMLLKAHGIMAWRNNSGVMVIPQTENWKRRFVRFGASGSPDIIGLIRPGGRFLGLECKLPGRLPTPAQHEFLKAIDENGGITAVINDVEQVEALLSGLKKQGSFGQ